MVSRALRNGLDFFFFLGYSGNRKLKDNGGYGLWICFVGFSCVHNIEKHVINRWLLFVAKLGASETNTMKTILIKNLQHKINLHFEIIVIKLKDHCKV